MYSIGTMISRFISPLNSVTPRKWRRQACSAAAMGPLGRDKPKNCRSVISIFVHSDRVAALIYHQSLKEAEREGAKSISDRGSTPPEAVPAPAIQPKRRASSRNNSEIRRRNHLIG